MRDFIFSVLLEFFFFYAVAGKSLWLLKIALYADPVRKRRVPGVNEIPTGQCSGRHSNLLSGNNGMDHRQTQGWETSIFDWGALLVSLAVGAVAVTYGLEAANSQTGQSMDILLGLTLSLVPWLCFLPRGRFAYSCATIFLAHSVARHLWRMCLALFIASASIFLARQQLFPA